MACPWRRRRHVRKGTFGLRKALSLPSFMEHRRCGLAVYMAHLAGQLQSLSQVPERRTKTTGVNSRASNHTKKRPTRKLGKRSRGPSCEVNVINLRRFFKSSRISRIKHDKSSLPPTSPFSGSQVPILQHFLLPPAPPAPLGAVVVGIPVTASVPLAPLAVEGPPLVEMLPSAPARSWGSGKIGDDVTVTLADLSPVNGRPVSNIFQSSKKIGCYWYGEILFPMINILDATGYVMVRYGETFVANL